MELKAPISVHENVTLKNLDMRVEEHVFRRPDPHANEGFLLSLIETHPVKHTPVPAVTDNDLCSHEFS
jgi:hypothetical protein